MQPSRLAVRACHGPCSALGRESSIAVLRSSLPEAAAGGVLRADRLDATRLALARMSCVVALSSFVTSVWRTALRSSCCVRTATRCCKNWVALVLSHTTCTVLSILLGILAARCAWVVRLLRSGSSTTVWLSMIPWWCTSPSCTLARTDETSYQWLVPNTPKPSCEQ